MKGFVYSALLLASLANAFPEGRNYAPKKPAYAPAPAPVPAALKLAPGPIKPYAFAYEVVDPLGDTNFGHRETSDGVVVEGEYRVILPDGRTQIVTYRADDVTGYVADVRYEGEIKPFKPAPPPVVPVPVAKGLAPRPVAKRNENTSEKDFAEQVVVKKTEVKEAPRRHNKKQHNGYYTPQPYHPF